jgi:hypothetical protein
MVRRNLGLVDNENDEVMIGAQKLAMYLADNNGAAPLTPQTSTSMTFMFA